MQDPLQWTAQRNRNVIRLGTWKKNSLSAHHFILLYSLKKKYYSRLGAKANASIWLCKLTEISPQQDPQPKPFR
jgi:hypothetical protein